MKEYSIIPQKFHYFNNSNNPKFLSTEKHHYYHHPRRLCNNSRTSSGLCVAGNRSLSGSRTCSQHLNLYWVPTRSSVLHKVHATAAETDQPRWWEKNAGPNMVDIHSTEEFLDALSEAGDRLVIAEFYGTWCASCRALFPKICKIAEEHPEILFLKVNFDENKSLCKSLNVKVLPYFHFYRGADGLVESFSCSLAKLQKLKDAIANHNTAQCSEGSLQSDGDRSVAPGG